MVTDLHFCDHKKPASFIYISLPIVFEIQMFFPKSSASLFIFDYSIFLHVPNLTYQFLPFSYCPARLVSNVPRSISSDCDFPVSWQLVISQCSWPLELPYKASYPPWTLLDLLRYSFQLWSFPCTFQWFSYQVTDACKPNLDYFFDPTSTFAPGVEFHIICPKPVHTDALKQTVL